jgi:hypothetical protein
MANDLNSFASTATAISGIAAATGNAKLAKVAGAVAVGSVLVNAFRGPMFGGSEAPLGHIPGEVSFASSETDWRVKLSIPTNNPAYLTSPLLQPLVDSGNSLVFPFTPQVNVTHSATYNSLDTTHNNYAFMAYEHSRVEQITITADFYCETSVDAAYWVAATHYLRSITKMSFGDSVDAGQPPPVVKLSGYGAYVFNSVPVVVKTFTMDLPKDVDYISASVGGYQDPLDFGNAFVGGKTSYAPVKSTITIQLMPIYSRTQQRRFSLDAFVDGVYLGNGGFI